MFEKKLHLTAKQTLKIFNSKYKLTAIMNYFTHYAVNYSLTVTLIMKIIVVKIINFH